MPGSSGTKRLLNPVAKLSTMPPRNQIQLSGTGEYLGEPNFALASGSACLKSDPKPRHPHSLTLTFIGNYPIHGDPTHTEFNAIFSIGPMATFGECDESDGPTVGVSSGKLRVMITNYPNPGGAAVGSAPDADDSNSFTVDVEIQNV